MSTDFDKLVQILKKKKEKGAEEYHFRPYLVDGVLCYIVLYLKHSTLTVESVNVKCKYNYEGTEFNQPYVLYYHKYKSFKTALELIPKLTTTYKILNGDLESPTNYEELKLENCILPYSADERCSICFENTTDTTLCNHYICFHCRDKCITQKQNKCPICRRENILQYYNNTIHLLNNCDNASLHAIFIHPHLLKQPDIDDSDEDASVNDDSDSDSDADEVEGVVNEEAPANDDSDSDSDSDDGDIENDVPIVQTENDVPIVQTENDVPIVQTENDVPIVQTENDVPLVPTENNVPIVPTENDVPLVPTENDVPLVLTENENENADMNYQIVAPSGVARVEWIHTFWTIRSRSNRK